MWGLESKNEQNWDKKGHTREQMLQGVIDYFMRVEEGPAEPAKPQEPAKPKNEGQFGLVSDTRMDELRAKLRQKLRGQMNFGVDPEIVIIGAEIMAGYIDRGIYAFVDLAKHMLSEFGEGIRPSLKSLYEYARADEEVRAAGLHKNMTPHEEVMEYDINSLKFEEIEEGSSESGNKPVSLLGRTEVQDKVVEGIKQKMLDALVSGERPFTSIVYIRNFAESLGMEVDRWGKTDIFLQELTEDALVRAAREVVEAQGKNVSTKELFELS